MPNPQLGGQFAPKVTFGGGDEAQVAAVLAQSSPNLCHIDAEYTFKPLINRNVPDFGRMHALLARQSAAIKESRRFQQVTCVQLLYVMHHVWIMKCAPTLAPDDKGANSILFYQT